MCPTAPDAPAPEINKGMFYARDSGLLKFKIQAGLLGRPINHAVRRLVAFTFHPFEPFAISVQRTNAEYVVNFHMRHSCS
ncbi:DET1-like isoform X1 [Silurus meridionalis]|nr:DET1-like isoform X1 [Silurus meridionalis]